METFALSRDGYYRKDPDALFYGFFAGWPVILWILAGSYTKTKIFFLGFFIDLFCLNY